MSNDCYYYDEVAALCGLFVQLQRGVSVTTASPAETAELIEVLIKAWGHRPRRRLPHGNGGDCRRRIILIGRRPVRNWTRHTISSLFCTEYYTVLRKINKTAATRVALFDSNMHQIVCRLGLRLAVFRGLLLQEGKGTGGRQKEKSAPMSGQVMVLR